MNGDPYLLQHVTLDYKTYITIFLGSMSNIPYISTYGVSFNPLICGYKSLKSFDGG